MSSGTTRIGVLLAAGRGRRMGGTKQLLSWPTDDGPKPLVAAAFDAIARVCAKMVVVLGHEADAVAAAIAPRDFRRIDVDPDGNMFASIRAGLRKAHEVDPAATIVLQPGDHPEISSATLDRLIRVAGDFPDCAVMPEYEGAGGHPVLIPPALVPPIIAADCPGGLRDYWQENPEICCRVPVEDAAVVQDVDRPG